MKNIQFVCVLSSLEENNEGCKTSTHKHQYVAGRFGWQTKNKGTVDRVRSENDDVTVSDDKLFMVFVVVINWRNTRSFISRHDHSSEFSPLQTSTRSE